MTVETRNVLIIAYYFPPMGLSGVQRTVKFAKYLPQYGWQPTVLTVTPTGYFAIDQSLLQEVEHAGVEILRTLSFDANHLFRKRGVVKMPSERVRKVLQFAGDTLLIPDTKIGWKRNAVKAATKLLTQKPFHMIFATAPPQTDFLIGMELKKRFGLPLVVDYRDAWFDYPFKFRPTPLHSFLHYKLEKKVLKAADRVIVTHRRVKESILKRYRVIGYNDIVILPQGYDPEDFQQREPRRHVRHERMRITHAGTFYAGRTPSALLHALQQLVTELPHLRGRIEINLLGNARDEDRLLVQRLGLQHDVTFAGYLDHHACVDAIVASDVNYVVLDNDYQSPGKLYEYLGARKMIFASVVDGYTKQYIQETNASICVPLNDVSAHREALLDLFHRFEQNKLKRIPEEFVQRYNRRRLTAELARQFESLMDYDRHAIVKVEETAA